MITQPNPGPCIHTPSQYYIDQDGYPIVMDDYAKYLLGIENPWCNSGELLLLEMFTDNNKISLNLMSHYNDLAVDSDSPNPFTNIQLNELYLYNIKPDDFILANDEMDRIIEKSTYSNVGDEKREYGFIPIIFWHDHTAIKDRNAFQQALKEDIK